MRLHKPLHQRLNLPRLINASGTLTSLGGCRTRPEVIQAMAEVAAEFVQLDEFHQKAGEYIARLLGVEAAMVISGAAAGLTLATAACMVGEDGSLSSRLPSPPPKHNVIIQCCHRNPFERAIQIAGATLLQIGNAIRTRPEDLESAIASGAASDDEAAAVVFFLQSALLDASLSLDETLEIAHAHKLPVIVDAAAELPPKQNLWALAQAGADLVIFSGSKDLRGPQTSGLMMGRRDLIASAMRQSAPHEHVVGRPMKAGKGVVAGMLAAVESYLVEDEKVRFAEWENIAKLIEESLNQVRGLRANRFTPQQPYIQPACVPRVAITLEETGSLSIPGLKKVLWEGDPPIAAEVIRDALIINTHTLTIEEAEIVVERVKGIYLDQS